jgi:hypothetical protein
MYRIVFVILPVMILSCTNLQEATKSADRPACQSVVEASLVTDTVYTVRPPLLLLKRSEYSNDTRYLHGDIVSVSESGVSFARSPDQQPRFYPLDKIECLIDSNNHITLGEWKYDPEVVWELELVCQKADSPNSQPISLVLEQNRISSYCIGPGEYRIVSVKFSSSDEYLDVSDSLRSSSFMVFDSSITYIGTLHSEYKRDLSPGTTAIPTSIIRRRGMAGSAAAGMVGGAVGGVLGYLSDQRVLEKARENRTLHGLRISIDSGYTPVFNGGLRLRQSPIDLERSP